MFSWWRQSKNDRPPWTPKRRPRTGLWFSFRPTSFCVLFPKILYRVKRKNLLETANGFLLYAMQLQTFLKIKLCLKYSLEPLRTAIAFFLFAMQLSTIIIYNLILLIRINFWPQRKKKIIYSVFLIFLCFLSTNNYSRALYVISHARPGQKCRHIPFSFCFLSAFSDLLSFRSLCFRFHWSADFYNPS